VTLKKSNFKNIFRRKIAFSPLLFHFSMPFYRQMDFIISSTFFITAKYSKSYQIIEFSYKKSFF